MTTGDHLMRLDNLLLALLGFTGMVIAGSWLLGRFHQARGHAQQAPTAGTVPVRQHHGSIPGR